MATNADKTLTPQWSAMAHAQTILPFMDGSQPPVLPSELEREIFEIAARSRPQSVPRFLLVARHVKSWLEPLLYETIIFDDQASSLLGGLEKPILSKDILFPILHSRPQLLDHARNLLIPFSSIDDGHIILPHCQRIENLCLSTSYKAHPHLFSLVLTLPLKRFYGALGPLFGSLPRVDLTHQFFGQITHLGLCDYPCEIVDSEFWSGLPLISNLTHFSLDSAWLDAFPAVLRTCPSLRVLVGIGLPMYEGPPPGLGTLPNDPRFVMMDLSSEDSDWQIGTRTGNDYWARAENFIAKRKAGVIDPLQYQLKE